MPEKSHKPGRISSPGGQEATADAVVAEDSAEAQSLEMIESMPIRNGSLIATVIEALPLDLC